MHVEVCLDLAPFLLEQHGQQKARAEPASEPGEQSGAPAGAKGRGGVSVPSEQVGPDHDVPVFDISQARIDVFLLRVGLRLGEKAIEIGGIRLVLPMVLEGVDVDLRALGRGRGGLERRRHYSISPERSCFAPATLEYGSMSYVTELQGDNDESATDSLCCSRELGRSDAERAGDTSQTRFHVHQSSGWARRVQDRAPVCRR